MPGEDGYAYPLSDGKNGKDGQYKFIILHKDGPREYKEKYDMHIDHFTFELDEPDGVIEPGERGSI